MVAKLADIRKQRSEVQKSYETIAFADKVTDAQKVELKALEDQLVELDSQVERITKAHELAAKSAQPVAGQDPAETGADPLVTRTVAATVEVDPYIKSKSLQVGGIMKMLAAGGNVREARIESKAIYGESHPVTRALNTGTGSAGGFIIPPDYMNEIIELLRPMAVVRAAGPRVIPMPRGTMVLPGQASPATASYSSEGVPPTTTQQTLNQIVASYKKLTALVPVSNDLMRYADPAVDAFVRDDLVKVIALRQDLAFISGDGTANGPRGFTSFAGGYAVANGGVAAVFSTTADSTAGSGGNYITSNEAYTLATAAQELGGLINKLDTANVPDMKRVWFMHPRSKNYLFNVQNALGVYVYRDEISRGQLLGYPFKTTTQIPTNIIDPTGTNSDCSFIALVEMTDAMILDSMQLELAVSRDGSYIDASGNTQSAFSNDQTIIRAIAEHDFQMRHDASIAVSQFVRWAPAIS
jgi:HK97 family phage major capsid protein